MARPKVVRGVIPYMYLDGRIQSMCLLVTIHVATDNLSIQGEHVERLYQTRLVAVVKSFQV
jgi:hypothetical protein